MQINIYKKEEPKIEKNNEITHISHLPNSKSVSLDNREFKMNFDKKKLMFYLI